MTKHLYLIFEKRLPLLQKLKCSGQDNCYERWFTDKYRIKERKKETGPVTYLITRYLLNVAERQPGSRLGWSVCASVTRATLPPALWASTTLTCKQIARFTRQPNEVLTARGWRPRSLNSFEKDWVSAIRGRSSATTTHVRTRDKSSPRVWGQER